MQAHVLDSMHFTDGSTFNVLKIQSHGIKSESNFYNGSKNENF